jgi:2-amino-4-hydroxy-6-hydroxymethyldihydropteridine diphosphokinase
MNLIYLSLGTNLGRREQHLEAALELIQSRVGTVVSVSRYYESEPWGYSSEYSFYNCCVSLSSALDPLPLLDKLLEIEMEMGRKREGKGYSDRIIDIDLLLHGDCKMDHPRLTLPHPSMGDRKFVLLPLAEIAPALIHPLTKRTISEMLQNCMDQSKVRALNQTGTA